MKPIRSAGLSILALSSALVITNAARAGNPPPTIDLTTDLTSTYAFGELAPGGSNSGGQVIAAETDIDNLISFGGPNPGKANGGITYTWSTTYSSYGASKPPVDARGQDLYASQGTINTDKNGNKSGTFVVPTPTVTSSTTSQYNTYTFIIAKFGHDEFVWDIAGAAPGTTFIVPGTGTGGGLSDWTLVNPFTVTITTHTPPHAPDGGTTAALLGLGVSALGFIRRKRR